MLKLSKRAMLIAFFSIVTVAGCTKKTEVQIEKPLARASVEDVKFRKMEKFISIVWNFPISEVRYDEINGFFLIKENKISLKDLENLYDSANEYKLNYEK